MNVALFVVLTLAGGMAAGLVLAWSLPAWLLLPSAAMLAGGILAGHRAVASFEEGRQP